MIDKIYWGINKAKIVFYFYFLENPLDVDAFSEEFDLRMRYGRVPPPGSASSTMPRPAHSMGANTPTSSSIGSSTPGKRIGGNGGMGGSLRPGSVAQLPSTRDFVDGRNDLMSTSQISENNSGIEINILLIYYLAVAPDFHLLR